MRSPITIRAHPSQTMFTPGSFATWSPVNIFALKPPKEKTRESARCRSRSGRAWTSQNEAVGCPGFSTTTWRAGPLPRKFCS